MAIRIDPRKTWEYVLECDRGLSEEQQTYWELRPLTVLEESKLQDMAVTADAESRAVSMNSGRVHLETLRYGLVGCRQFRDQDGTEVPFTSKFNKGLAREIVTDDFLSGLHPDWRRELAIAIEQGATLSEEDRKN